MFRYVLLSCAMILAASGPAWSAPLRFSYVGAEGDLSFQMDSNPAPFATSSDLASFEVAPTGVSNGAPSDFGGGIYFYTDALFGGFETENGEFLTSGAQLFSGSINSPIFSPGAYQLLGFEGTPDGVLTISPAATVSSAPEPGAWALMVGGIGMLGAVMRSRKARRDENAAAEAATA